MSSNDQHPHLKKIGNLYLPNTDPGKWLIRDGLTSDGFPKYQYDRIEVSLALCRQKRTCVDGGAHIGSWAVHLAKHFKLVHCFEPIPLNFECLGLNTQVLPNVAIHPYALSDQEGSVPMMPAGGKSFQWRVHREAANPVPINCVPLDKLEIMDLDLLKLDVEGHEYEALRGAAETIARCRPVVVIEEKLDRELLGSKLLIELGMELVTQMKHDRIFKWPT